MRPEDEFIQLMKKKIVSILNNTNSSNRKEIRANVFLRARIGKKECNILLKSLEKDNVIKNKKRGILIL